MTSPLISIPACARRPDIPLGRVALRRFVIEQRLGIRTGGNDKHPRLVVDPKEVRERILENRYSRKREARKAVGYRSARRELHEDVKC